MEQPYSLANRSALITGASQGFGYAVAQAYLAAGADIAICARNAEKLEVARAELQASFPQRQIIAQPCDVADAAQVESLVQAAIDAFGQVQILVTNAGVYGPMGALDAVNWDEWVEAMEINLYGTLLPIRALIPHFKQHSYGKIVNLSGGGATNPMPNISAYAASKAAVVRMTETLALELEAYHVTVNAVAPGALNTPLQDQLLTAGPDVVGESLYKRILAVREGGGAPLEVGAGLCVFLGSAASDSINGRLISAVWDDWRDLPNHGDELTKSDVYTLRRIVPKDRGFTWGDV